MANPTFVAQAAVRRHLRIGSGIAGLGAALVVAWIASGFADTLVERLAQFDMGTSLYRRAQWASTTAVACFLAAAASLIVWIVGHSLRAALGLPTREAPPLAQRLFAARIVVALVALLWLAVWSIDEILLRGCDWAPITSLGLGLLVCANFAYDAPRLLGDALSALRARVGLLAVPLRALDHLPASGRVHLRGTVAAAAGVLASDHGACVYRLRAASPTDSDAERAEIVPFRLDDGGVQVMVDGTAGCIVEARQPIRAVAGADAVPLDATIRVGDRIEVIGTVERRDGDAYRAALPIIAASPHQPLYLFASGPAMNRRLVMAAAVEACCGAALLLCTAGLLITWLHLRAIAHPDLLRLPPH